MGGGRREAKARRRRPVPEGYTSNENTGGGRLIVIAVDQAGIRFGGSTAMMSTLAGFIDKLLPSDRVAVVGFGPDGPPLDVHRRFGTRERAGLSHDRPEAARGADDI